MLFADENSGGKAAALMLVSGLVSSAATWLATFWQRERDKKAAGTAKQEESIIATQRELIERLQIENDALEREIEKGRDRDQAKANLLEACRIQTIVRRRHIRYLESLLTATGTKFDKYEEADEREPSSGTGTDVKPALPPDTKGQS